MKNLLKIPFAVAALVMAGPVAMAQPEEQPRAKAAAAAGFGHYSPRAEYIEQISTSQYVRMRDGVRLAVRIDRPAIDGKPVDTPLPVIWHHTLSISQRDADGAGDRVSDYRRMSDLTRYGYVVVQVARRGNGQSLGEMRGYHDRNETQDSFEMIGWLARQPWSDGNVGMYGCSNTGDAAMQALTLRPPALKAVWAGCFSWHKYDAFRRGGIYAQWGTGPSRTVEQDMALAPVDGDEDKSLLAIAARQHQNSTPLLEMWKGLPYRDSFSDIAKSRFWGEGSVANYDEAIRLSGVPLYIQGGWFDELRDQGVQAWMNIPGSRLIIGPWKHCDNDDFALLQEMLRFFDYHLKGIDTGIDRQEPIHYFAMDGKGGGAWKAADSWPAAGRDGLTLHLAKDSLSMADAMPWQREFDTQFDLSCPDAGSGSRVQPCHVDGAGPSFASEPLSREVSIMGDGVMHLTVAVDGPDANIFAYLEDVAPDGTVRVITEGRQKASLRALADAPWKTPEGLPWHRSYEEDRAPLEPGKPVELVFAMMPTAYSFQPGHRIQVTITGADHRERIRDPENPPHVTLIGGGDNDSRIAFPTME